MDGWKEGWMDGWVGGWIEEGRKERTMMDEWIRRRMRVKSTDPLGPIQAQFAVCLVRCC